MKYILSIDQGTTSTRALLYDKEGKLVFKAQQEVACLYPFDGWVEQDALDIFLSVVNVINDCLAKMNITYDNIDSIGITNQRETTVIFDKETGMPLYNAIVWQSRQTVDICESWKPYEKMVHEKTGLIINPYFSASKIRFILDRIENGYERAKRGEILFGTIDTWLMYKLSNKKIFKTDYTNASRTMLFNINTLEYDKELLKLFKIPQKMLPKVQPSSSFFGYASFLNKKLKIYGVAGDQQAALFGQNCFESGDSKNTYGTGCFMLMNIGDKPILSNNGLITTIIATADGHVSYALEGSVFIGGASIQWLRDSLRMINNASESERYATRVKDSGGVYVVPAFVGLGAPYWDDACRGAIFGLNRGTTKEHFIQAVLNSIALQTKDVIKKIEEETNIKLKILKVDGGATANNYLMQYQANILNSKIILPECLETTSLGVAYLAGLGSGYFKDLDDIKKIHKISKEFYPLMEESERAEIDKKWAKAIEATRVFK
ncbi:MAG: glycerol kinase GlpK [Bacilli bacterium]|nr:glycerol kinase GlpK [Bacilli bacterium]